MKENRSYFLDKVKVLESNDRILIIDSGRWKGSYLVGFGKTSWRGVTWLSFWKLWWVWVGN